MWVIITVLLLVVQSHPSGSSELDDVDTQSIMQIIDEQRLIDHINYIDPLDLPHSNPNYQILPKLYTLTMLKYQQFSEFFNLDYTLNMIMHQNQELDYNALDITFWNAFFKVYFMNTNIFPINDDFCRYLYIMQQLKVSADVDTINIIINGLNTHHQINDSDRESRIKEIFAIMMHGNIAPNIETYEGLMHSYTHNNNIKDAHKLWNKMSFDDPEDFIIIPSQRLFADYLNIICKDQDGEWMDFVDLIEYYEELFGVDIGMLKVIRYGAMYYNELGKIPAFVDSYHSYFLNTTDDEMFADAQRFFVLGMIIKRMFNQSLDEYNEWIDIQTDISMLLLNAQLINNQHIVNGIHFVLQNSDISAMELQSLINGTMGVGIAYDHMPTFEILMRLCRQSNNMEFAMHFWSTMNPYMIPSKTLYREYLSIVAMDTSAEDVFYFVKSMDEYSTLFGIDATFFKLYSMVLRNPQNEPVIHDLKEHFKEPCQKYLLLQSSEPNVDWISLQKWFRVYRSIYGADKTFFTMYQQAFKTHNQTALLPAFVRRFHLLFLYTSDAEIFTIGQDFLGMGMMAQIESGSNVDEYIEWINITTSKVKSEFNDFQLRKKQLGLEILNYCHMHRYQHYNQKFMHIDLIQIINKNMSLAESEVFDFLQFDGITDRLQIAWMIQRRAVPRRRVGKYHKYVWFQCNVQVKDFILNYFNLDMEYIVYYNDYGFWNIVYHRNRMKDAMRQRTKVKPEYDICAAAMTKLKPY